MAQDSTTCGVIIRLISPGGAAGIRASLQDILSSSDTELLQSYAAEDYDYEVYVVVPGTTPFDLATIRYTHDIEGGRARRAAERGEETHK
jgi:hypothetical protein